MPLLLLTRDKKRMGVCAAPAWMTAAGWLSAAVIIVANTVFLRALIGGA